MLKKIQGLYSIATEKIEQETKKFGKGVIYAINFFPDLIKILEYKTYNDFCLPDEHEWSNGKICCINSKSIINKGLVKILCKECSDKRISTGGVLGLYHNYLLCGKNRKNSSINSDKI